MKFIDLGLDQRILDGIDAMGYETATPVQQQVMVPILEGKDIIAAAQTGTGKTAAFLLPLLLVAVYNSPAFTTKKLLLTALTLNGTAVV